MSRPRYVEVDEAGFLVWVLTPYGWMPVKLESAREVLRKVEGLKDGEFFVTKAVEVQGWD